MSTKVTLMEVVSRSSKLFRLLFGSKPRAACVVCASPEGPDEPLASCEALGCSAKYCAACFSSQDGGVCRVCGQRLEQPEVPGLQLEWWVSESLHLCVHLALCRGSNLPWWGGGGRQPEVAGLLLEWWVSLQGVNDTSLTLESTKLLSLALKQPPNMGEWKRGVSWGN